MLHTLARAFDNAKDDGYTEGGGIGMNEKQLCPICDKEMTNAAYNFCSKKCNTENNRRRWQQPISRQTFDKIHAFIESGPEDVRLLLSDHFTRDKYFNARENSLLIED